MPSTGETEASLNCLTRSDLKNKQKMVESLQTLAGCHQKMRTSVFWGQILSITRDCLGSELGTYSVKQRALCPWGTREEKSTSIIVGGVTDLSRVSKAECLSPLLRTGVSVCPDR